jgi:hypothetical protein
MWCENGSVSLGAAALHELNSARAMARCVVFILDFHSRIAGNFEKEEGHVNCNGSRAVSNWRSLSFSERPTKA